MCSKLNECPTNIESLKFPTTPGLSPGVGLRKQGLLALQMMPCTQGSVPAEGMALLGKWPGRERDSRLSLAWILNVGLRIKNNEERIKTYFKTAASVITSPNDGLQGVLTGLNNRCHLLKLLLHVVSKTENNFKELL